MSASHRSSRMCALVLCVLLPASANAQILTPPSQSPPPELLNTPVLRTASERALPDLAAANQTAKADPVGNGIGYGALIGAGAGIGFMAVMYARCDAGCEAPAEGPMFLTAAAVGAGIGAAVGLAIDGARKSTARRVSVGASVAPRRQGVKVTVRF